MAQCRAQQFSFTKVKPLQHVLEVHVDSTERIPVDWLQCHHLIICPSCHLPFEMTASGTAAPHACGGSQPDTPPLMQSPAASPKTPRAFAPCPKCGRTFAVKDNGGPWRHMCTPAALPADTASAPPIHPAEAHTGDGDGQSAVPASAPASAQPTQPSERQTGMRVVSKQSRATREWACEVVRLAEAFTALPTLASYLAFTSLIEEYPPLVALQRRRTARESEVPKVPIRDPTATGATSRARYLKCLHRLKKGAYARARAALFPSTPIMFDDADEAKVRPLYPSATSPLICPPLLLDPHRTRITPTQVCSYLNSRTPDAAGGVSKWTYDALIDAFCSSKNPKDLAVLAKVVETIAAAQGLSEQIWKHLRIVRGVAISKPDGGIRPLGIGEALVIVTAGVLTRQYRKDLKALIGPFDVGFATPGGADVLTHTVRAALSLGNSPRCVIKVDVANAFNSISRNAVLAAAHKIPALWPFVRARYGAEFDAQFTRQASQHKVNIPVAEGVAQGCPLAGPLYSAAQAVGYAKVREQSPSTLLSSFFDDGYIVDTPAKAFAALHLLRAELTKIGLTLKTSKCKAYMPQPTAEFGDLALQAGVTIDQGVLVAGSPVGSDDFVSDHLEQKLVEVRRELADLHEVLSLSAQFSDVTAQGIFSILRKCIPTEFTNLMRSVPPRLSIPFASRVDEAVWTTARHVLHLAGRLDNAHETRDRVFLPVRNGGLGIMSLVDTAHAAYSGSWALCGETVRQLLRDTIDVPADWYVPTPSSPVSPILMDLASSVRQLQQSNALANVTPTSWILTSESRVQKVISQNLSDAKSDRILEGIFSPVMRASFLGCRTPESGAWVEASPCFPWSRLTDAVFRCAAKTRLSAHPESIDFCQCISKSSSASFPHLFYCEKAAGARDWRHNLIRDTLVQGLRVVFPQPGHSPSHMYVITGHSVNLMLFLVCDAVTFGSSLSVAHSPSVQCSTSLWSAPLRV